MTTTPVQRALAGAAAIVLAFGSGAPAQPWWRPEPADSPMAARSEIAGLEPPVSPLRVERLASIPMPNWRPGHRGVDLEASADHVVVSPGAGVVTFAGFVVDRPVVSILLDDGLVASFEPVTPAVAVGDRVRRGQQIGQVAPSPMHCGAHACVHWGLRVDGAYVDPLDYLEGFGEIRLLP